MFQLSQKLLKTKLNQVKSRISFGTHFHFAPVCGILRPFRGILRPFRTKHWSPKVPKFKENSKQMQGRQLIISTSCTK